MSYNVCYQGTRAVQEAAALEDARDWIANPAKFQRIMDALRGLKGENFSPRTKVSRARFWLSFEGIQGLPATAMIRAAWKM